MRYPLDVPDELLIEHVCSILVNTDCDVADALTVLDRMDAVEMAADIEEKILHNQLERCPLCDRWAWNSPGYWNEYKGCCAECGELDD